MLARRMTAAESPPSESLCRACCTCDVDVDGWDGTAYCRTKPSSRKRTKRLLAASPCAAGSASSRTDPYASKEVVGKGLKRFEVGKVAPKQADYEQISSRVWSVLGQNPSNFTLNGTNCYIVGTGENRLLIDTGESDFGNVKFMAKLEECMHRIGCTGFSEILITHMHHDHYGGVPSLLRKYGKHIKIGKLALRNGMADSMFTTISTLQERGIKPLLDGPDGKPRFRGSGNDLPTADEMLPWPDEDAEAGKKLDWDRFNRTKAELVRDYQRVWEAWDFMQKLGSEYYYHELTDGEAITVEGATLKCLHTPGHADDHCSFWLEEESCLFSGDHVLGFGTTLMQNLYDYMQSLDTMLALRPVHLYPGHGPVIEAGSDFIKRYIEHRNAREQQIVSTMANYFNTVQGPGLTSSMLAKLIYTNTPKSNMWMAVQNVERVLLKLDREGRASAYRQRSNQLERVSLPHHGYVAKLDAGMVWYLHRPAADLASGRVDQFLAQMRQLFRNTTDDLFESMNQAQHIQAKAILAEADQRLWDSLYKQVAQNKQQQQKPKSKSRL